MEQVRLAGRRDGVAASEVLHKQRQPCTHSHGYQMGKAGSGGIAMAPVWPTFQPGMVLAQSNSGLSLNRPLPGRAPPGIQRAVESGGRLMPWASLWERW